MPRKKVRKTAKKRVAKAKKKPIKKRVTTKKRAAKKRVQKPRAQKPKAKENIVGVVTHYFPHVKAGVIKLKAPLSVGDSIRIKGHTTDFVQKIDSLQIDRKPITSAKRGQEIGLLVNYRVRRHDMAYKV